MSISASPSVADIAANAARVRERIRSAGGDPDRVLVVAVTKAFPVAVARTAIDAGLTHLGENYAQELVDKVRGFAAAPPVAEPSWHFIGRLQSNKVKLIAPHVELWQTVDRSAIAEAIAHHAPGAGVLLQVNASGEDQKAGCRADEATVGGLLEACRSLGLVVRGLMAIGVHDDPSATRAAFATTRALADRFALDECSMGMSGDLEIAVEEGSTMVRIGRDLFGTRPIRTT